MNKMLPETISKIPFTLAILILSAFLNHISAQRMDKISHLKGTKTISGVKVTVTEEGYVDSLTYCGSDTGPYFAGNDYSRSCCKTGSYIFTFSQPVKEVYLNIAALSVSDSYNEEAQVYVNGSHYFINDIGKENSCEPIVVISKEGNIKPCSGCTGSGANKIKITGPITTIKVTCNIIKGEPQGMVFSIFMGEKAKDVPISFTTSIAESAAGMGKELTIESEQLKDAEISLKDSNENKIEILYRNILSNMVVIDASALPKGTYNIEIKVGDAVEKQKLLIE